MVYVLLAGAILAEVLGTTALQVQRRLHPAVAVRRHRGHLRDLVRAAGPDAEDHGGRTAYAIWSAVGTALIAAIGIVFLGEAATWARMLGIALVIAGVVILNLREPVALSRPMPARSRI